MLYKARFKAVNAEYAYTGMKPDKKIDDMMNMAENVAEYSDAFYDDAYIMKSPDGKIYLVEKKVFEALFEKED